MSRFARRVDDNHRTILDALERAGASVLSLAPLGRGAPDVAFGICGITTLAEIKPASSLKAHKRKPNQLAWAAKWKGGVVHELRTPEEAWTLVNLIRLTSATRTKAAVALREAGRDGEAGIRGRCVWCGVIGPVHRESDALSDYVCLDANACVAWMHPPTTERIPVEPDPLDEGRQQRTAAPKYSDPFVEGIMNRDVAAAIPTSNPLNRTRSCRSKP